MKSFKISLTDKIGDYFDLYLHLTHLSSLYDKFTIQLYKDEYHVTILTCNFIELVSKLIKLDYTQYIDVFVYAQTQGIDNSNELTQLFVILNRYRNSESHEFLIKFNYSEFY